MACDRAAGRGRASRAGTRRYKYSHSKYSGPWPRPTRWYVTMDTDPNPNPNPDPEPQPYEPRTTRWMRPSHVTWLSPHPRYEAMDTVPAWACRVRGDAASWRKVSKQHVVKHNTHL